MAFQQSMIAIYKTAKRELGYNAIRFLQMVIDRGGVEAAKQLLNAPVVSDGFTTLWEHHRLDLSVEAHVLKDEFAPLFTDAERRTARQRLAEYGFATD
jgi:hypothetical protein